MPEITPLHDPDRSFMTLNEALNEWGIGTTVGYELAQKNQLPVPVFRIGREYRISRAAFDAMRTAQHPVQSDLGTQAA